MKRLLLAILLCIGACGAADARRQKSGPTRLVRPEKVDTPATAPYDTVRPGAVRFSGYDKPNGATRETFFVTNLDTLHIAGLGVEFQYFDMAGRQLHRAEHTLMLELPAGETRAAGVRSWDSNNAFHYYRSQPPKRRRSSPYRVKSRLLYVLRRR